MLKRLDVAEILATEQRRGARRRAVTIALATVVVLAIAVGGFWGWRTLQGRTSTDYVTDAVTRGDLVVTLVATGTIEPVHSVGVSSLIAGTLISVDVDYTATVTKGQQLASLDPRDYAARRERARAAVAAQVAARNASATILTDAQAALRRARELPQGEVISSRDVDLAKTALARAEANVAVADAQLSVAQADLASAQSDYDKTIIVSPIDGTILDVNAVTGQTVSAATLASPLFTIASDLRKLNLDIDIDEADVLRVNVGDKASFTVEAQPDRLVAGTVRQVRSGPTESDGVTSYTTIIDVDNAKGLLRPGMTATASIVTDSATNALTVANSALRFAPKDAANVDGQRRVFVLRDGVLRQIMVAIGLSDGIRTEIIAGELSVGDLVVTGTRSN